MAGPRLLIVTGKGGTGKTTVAAALGVHLSRQRQRVLIVELASDRGLARLFDRDRLETQPVPLAPRLQAVVVAQQPLLEAYFRRILKLRFLADRLLSSVTFNALTTAAPGVTEFLVLEHIHQWIQSSKRGRHTYDVIVVDAPATGHALRLLRTPGQLASLVPAGPIGSSARRLVDLLRNPALTQILLVTIADEMAVTETLEARKALTHGPKIQLARPVLNRVVARRFDADEIKQISQLSARRRNDPLLAAARAQIAMRRDVELQRTKLRRAFGAPPVSLREVYAHRLDHSDLEQMGRAIVGGLFHP